MLFDVIMLYYIVAEQE